MNRATRMLIMDRKIVVKLIEGDSFNSIAKELGVGKRRIKKLYSKALGAGYITLLRPLPPFPEKLFSEKLEDTNEPKSSTPKSIYDELLSPYLADIKTKIELEYHQVTIMEELPIKVPKSSFSRFLKRHGLELKKKKLNKVVPEIFT